MKNKGIKKINLTLLALEPRYMYDAAGFATLDEVKNIMYANSVSDIAGLQSSEIVNQAERDSAGTFHSPDSLAFPIFKEVSGAGLREEFLPVSEAQTLKDIPAGPSGSSVFSLSGGFSRSSLQGGPIGYLWEFPTREGGLTDIPPAGYYSELQQALIQGRTPESETEIQADAYFWGENAQNDFDEWQAGREDALEEEGTADDFLDSFYPQSEQVVEQFEEAVENADLSILNEYLDLLDNTNTESELDGLERYVRTLDDAVRLDMQTESALDDLSGYGDREEQLLLEAKDDQAFENTLKKADDLFNFETESIQKYSDFDNLDWSLWPNDMRDVGSTADIGSDDLSVWENQELGSEEGTAPLDNQSFSAQIQQHVKEFDDGITELIQAISGRKTAFVK